MFPKKPLTICTIAKASIIKKAKDQFHIFLIPNQIDPNKNAKRLKDKTNLELLLIFSNSRT